MTFECWKCKDTLREGAPEEGPSARGKVRGGTGSGKKHIFTPMICPRCHKTRGMKAKGD